MSTTHDPDRRWNFDTTGRGNGQDGPEAFAWMQTIESLDCRNWRPSSELYPALTALRRELAEHAA